MEVELLDERSPGLLQQVMRVKLEYINKVIGANLQDVSGA